MTLFNASPISNLFKMGNNNLNVVNLRFEAVETRPSNVLVVAVNVDVLCHVHLGSAADGKQSSHNEN